MISIGTIIPNLIVILLVNFSLYFGQFYGTIFGAICGLVFDLISGGALGTSMFSLTLSGFMAGYFYNDNKTDFNLSSMFFVLIVFICAAINSFFYMILTSSEIKFTASHLILEQVILPGVYTALFALFIIIYKQRRAIL